MVLGENGHDSFLLLVFSTDWMFRAAEFSLLKREEPKEFLSWVGTKWKTTFV